MLDTTRSRWFSLLGCLGTIFLASVSFAKDAPKGYAGTYRVVAMPFDLRATYAIIKLEVGPQGQPQVNVLDIAKSMPFYEEPSFSPEPKVKSAEATAAGGLVKIVLHTTLGDWVLEARHDRRINDRLPGSLFDGARLLPVFLVPTDVEQLGKDDRRVFTDIQPHKEIMGLYRDITTFSLFVHNSPAAEQSASLFSRVQQTEQGMPEKLPKLLEKLHAQHPSHPSLIPDVVFYLNTVARKQFDAEALAKWVRAAEETAVEFGPALLRHTRIQMATALVDVKAGEQLALELARKAVKALTDKDSTEARLSVWKVLHAALIKADNVEEARTLSERIARLDATLDREHSPRLAALVPVKFAGRAGQSKRVVVMELMTSSNDWLSEPYETALDALEKDYNRTEVVLVRYHMHKSFFCCDPLINSDAVARFSYYSRTLPRPKFGQMYGPPALRCSGKKLPPRARSNDLNDMAENLHEQFRKQIDPLLEEEEAATLTAEVARKGNQLTIQAQVKGLKDPGAGKKLRFLLIEDVVRHRGENSRRLHRQVFRGYAGGREGVALTTKESKHTVRLDLDELRGKLGDAIDDLNAVSFHSVDRPLALKELRLIALVQDDNTAEILQAIQVDVPPTKGE